MEWDQLELVQEPVERVVVALERVRDSWVLDIQTRRGQPPLHQWENDRYNELTYQEACQTLEDHLASLAQRLSWIRGRGMSSGR